MYRHLATALLLLIHTNKQGALCILYKFAILPVKTFFFHIEVLKQNQLMTQFH